MGPVSFSFFLCTIFSNLPFLQVGYKIVEIPVICVIMKSMQ